MNILASDIKSMTLEQLETLTVAAGFPRYRATQLYQGLSRAVNDFSEISNLPKAFIDHLRQNTTLTDCQIVNKSTSALDGTVKYLVKLYNNAMVECVVMEYAHGLSACLSTQAGCRMGCAFCASTRDGLRRNLTAGEMLDQYRFLSKDLGRRIDNIVLMGMGEPLDNYENVVRFLGLITDPRGTGLSVRAITLSTCGLCDEIRALADLRPGLTLSVSLHAPNDSLRRQIMPIAKKYSLTELIDACRYYETQTGRRVSFEYTLIKHFNDAPEQALQLCRLLSPLKHKHVNLINVNPVEGRPFERCEVSDIRAFQQCLARQNVSATVRRTLGGDISGSCGQLRARWE